jgi:hypothetical protein
LTVSGDSATNNIDLASGGTADFDIALTGAGTASFASTAEFLFDLNATGVSDVIDFTDLTDASLVTFNTNVVNFTDLGGLIAGNTYTLFTFDGATQAENYTGLLAVGSGLGSFTGNFIYNATSIQLAVVPEPSTFAMLLGGFGALLAFQCARRRQA